MGCTLPLRWHQLIEQELIHGGLLGSSTLVAITGGFAWNRDVAGGSGRGRNAPKSYHEELIAFARNPATAELVSACAAAITQIDAAAVVDIEWYLHDIKAINRPVQDVQIEVAFAVVGNLFSEADIVFHPLKHRLSS